MTVASAVLDDIVIEEARAVAAMHVADPLGFCFGCLEISARLAGSPCPQKVWTAMVLLAIEQVGV